MLGEERWPARNDVLWLAGLSAVRAAVPLIALAFGGALPGFPSYSYQGPRGDASGYIDTARAIISAGAGLRLLLPGSPRSGCCRSPRRSLGVAPLSRTAVTG